MSNYDQQQSINSNGNNPNEIRRQVETFKDRELAWIAHHVCSSGLVKPEQILPSNIKNDLISILQILCNSSLNFNKIMQSKSDSLIPNEHFEWLLNSFRAQLFTCSILTKGYTESDRSSLIDIYYTNEPLGFIYSFFDLNKRLMPTFRNSFIVSSIDDKIKLMNAIKDKWLKIIKNDKYTTWINEKDDQHLDYLYSHLKRTSRLILVDSTITIPTNMYIALILASLDTIGIERLATQDYEISQAILDSKKISIDKIKQAWSQKKYNDAGNAKRPYHLPLTKKSKERLEKMAKIERKSAVAKLNELINSSYESKYTDHDGRELY